MLVPKTVLETPPLEIYKLGDDQCCANRPVGLER